MQTQTQGNWSYSHVVLIGKVVDFEKMSSAAGETLVAVVETKCRNGKAARNKVYSKNVQNFHVGDVVRAMGELYGAGIVNTAAEGGECALIKKTENTQDDNAQTLQANSQTADKYSGETAGGHTDQKTTPSPSVAQKVAAEQGQPKASTPNTSHQVSMTPNKMSGNPLGQKPTPTSQAGNQTGGSSSSTAERPRRFSMISQPGSYDDSTPPQEGDVENKQTLRTGARQPAATPDTRNAQQSAAGKNPFAAGFGGSPFGQQRQPNNQPAAKLGDKNNSGHSQASDNNPPPVGMDEIDEEIPF